MGNSPLPPVSDARIDKCAKKLKCMKYISLFCSLILLIVKNEEVTRFWSIFSPHDREGIGLIRRDDFFEKIVEEPRTFFGDSILDFVECDAQDVMTFGEFVETFCLFALFERNDVLRCETFLDLNLSVSSSHSLFLLSLSPYLSSFILFVRQEEDGLCRSR
jgi:hypothetical protein